MTIVYLCRVSTATIAEGGIRYTVAHGNINEAQAKRLYDSLAGLDLSEEYVRALKGQRAFGIANISGWGMPRPFINMVRAAYLEHMEQQIRTAHLSYAEAKAQGELVEQQSFRGYGKFFLATQAEFLDRIRISRDTTEARVAGCQITLALAVYENRHGAYPESLDELRSKVGWEVRRDPFSGEDFIYRPEGDGYILYSIGPNLTDDGGLEGRNDPWGKKAGDIVWRMER